MFSPFKFVWLRIIFTFILYSLVRLGFYLYHYKTFLDYSALEIAYSFLVGLRFDLSAVCLVNSLLVLICCLLPKYKPQSRKILNLYWIISNSVFLFLMIGDIEYYSFNNQHMQAHNFLIAKDIQNQGAGVILYYWPMFLVSLSPLFLMSYFGNKLLKKETKRSYYRSNLSHLIASLMSVVICVLCVRGGLQVKPLSPTHAFADQDENLGQLSLNSCFTILKSIDQKKLKRVSIFKTDKEAREIVLARQVSREKKEFGDFKGSNVLIILVESLSLEYTGALGGKSYTPFINELSKKSLSFTRAFAGGKRSIDAMPTIFAGLPSISDAPFISSPYQSMRTLGLADIFKDEGYSSSFFHGGHNGTMYFDTMAQRFGFERYLGMDEYPNKEHYDGKWGIFDHHFLKFCADSMNEQKKPFFNTIFTLSSHNPYTIPKGFEERFPKGELEIHESIGYADKALEIFFQYAKKQDWYNNTLFIITADHTQKARKKEFSYKIQDYRVPLIYFHPKKSLPLGRQDIITSQSAIGSSLIDLFNFKAKWTFFGPSAFQGDTDKAYAFLRKANDFYLVREENFYTLNRNMKFSQEPSPWSVSPKVDEQRESNKVFLEALYQISNNAIMERKNDMIEVSF